MVASVLLPVLLESCSKPIQPEIQKPRLFISLRDDSGKTVMGATVRLYKNVADTGITKISDSSGAVLFTELEPTLYHWLAEKGCKTNRISQTSLNRDLIPDAVLYGYSVLSETGALKVVNNTPDIYKLYDSLFTVNIHKDTPYTGYWRVGSHLLHTQKIDPTAIIKDTLISIRCGDTTILNLPF